MVHACIRPASRPSRASTEASMRAIASRVSYTGRFRALSTSVTCSPMTTRQPAASYAAMHASGNFVVPGSTSVVVPPRTSSVRPSRGGEVLVLLGHHRLHAEDQRKPVLDIIGEYPTDRVGVADVHVTVQEARCDHHFRGVDDPVCGDVAELVGLADVSDLPLGMTTVPSRMTRLSSSTVSTNSALSILRVESDTDPPIERCLKPAVSEAPIW